MQAAPLTGKHGDGLALQEGPTDSVQLPNSLQSYTRRHTYGTRSKKVNTLRTYCDATCGTNTVKFTHICMYVNKSTYVQS